MTLALDYIDNLPLDPAVRPMGLRAAAPTAPRTDKKEGAAVAGNALLAFTANLTAQHKDDVLNSFGLAQLSTTKTIDATKDPIGYYQNVVKILTNIGYTGQSVNFANYQTKTRTVEIEQVVLEIMANLVTAGELAIVKAAVAALKASADESGAPWSIYNSSSTKSNNGSFSIGLADETNGNVAVKLSAFHFTGSETSTKFLWMSYSSTEVQIQDGNSELVLNDSVYARVRGTVAGRMSDHAAGYLADLPL